MKRVVFYISGGISLLLAFIMSLVINSRIDSIDSQQMAERWSNVQECSQISCFFSENAKIEPVFFDELEYNINTSLREASIESFSENESARMWVDTYSADGQVYVSSDYGSVNLDAIGIGGDFFLFHPQKLLYGNYFSGDDLNHDMCIIDQDAAWQLFGSNDVVGMTVYIGGIPHIISGVIERESGRLENAAGLDGSVIYVSYETLSELGSINGINHFEIVMPNPVSGFALEKVKSLISLDEKEYEIIENSTRYSFINRLGLIRDFGTRSMNGKSIIYPYWENIARGQEDILALLTLVYVLFAVYTVIVAVFIIVRYWKHKKWTIKGVVKKLLNYLDALREKKRRKNKKEEDYEKI